MTPLPRILLPNFRKKQADKGYTVHEILTLASVVQLEAGRRQTSDMKKVAQVFTTVLKNGTRAEIFAVRPEQMKYSTIPTLITHINPRDFLLDRFAA